jgi:hypothetical protein
MSLQPAYWPPLSREHVDGARLFADREEMVAALGVRRGGVIAEVGVGRGEFSEFLVRNLEPGEFVAFDTFTMDEFPHVWGTPTTEYLDGMSHRDCYLDRMRPFEDRLSLEVGPSRETLARQAPARFDLIYIDAQHDYESVLADASLAAAALRPDGFLVFNDYLLFDPFVGQYYGVVQVVNDMVVNQNWKVAGFALEQQMFCDIAIYRTTARQIGFKRRGPRRTPDSSARASK